MRVIVQKFGGTSLASEEARIAVARRVIEARAKGFTPVVVVSAMGRFGDPYATDTLIALAQAAFQETAPRELDLLLSCGEIISAVVVANTLRATGVERVVVLTGAQVGVVTDLNYGNARILRIEPDHLIRHLERGDQVVVTGFQGVTETGDITTLGRGGSDTTAAALGLTLRAEVVEIYSDVDGIKTADPQVVPEARTLRWMTYEELLELTSQGARVVHPRAVDLAMRANVPMRVRHTMEDGPGTLISHGFETVPLDVERRGARWVTGVTHRSRLTRLSVAGGPDDAGAGHVAVFKMLADAGISVDLIHLGPHERSFVVASDHAQRAVGLLDDAGFEVEVTSGCAKVSVVGSGMRGQPGVMAKVADALDAEGIPILQTADSQMTISCLVPEGRVQAAVRALHRRFGLDGAQEVA